MEASTSLWRNIPSQVSTRSYFSLYSDDHHVNTSPLLRAIGKFPMVGANIEISKICVRDLNKPRDFTCSPSTKLVTDYNEILVRKTVI